MDPYETPQAQIYEDVQTVPKKRRWALYGAYLGGLLIPGILFICFLVFDSKIGGIMVFPILAVISGSVGMTIGWIIDIWPSCRNIIAVKVRSTAD